MGRLANDRFAPKAVVRAYGVSDDLDRGYFCTPCARYSEQTKQRRPLEICGRPYRGRSDAVVLTRTSYDPGVQLQRMSLTLICLGIRPSLKNRSAVACWLAAIWSVTGVTRSHPSPGNFTANREYYRDFPFWASKRRLRSKTPLCCSHFSDNSLRKLTGKIFRETGTFQAVTGNFDTANTWRRSSGVHSQSRCSLSARRCSRVRVSTSGTKSSLTSPRLCNARYELEISTH